MLFAIAAFWPALRQFQTTQLLRDPRFALDPAPYGAILTGTFDHATPACMGVLLAAAIAASGCDGSHDDEGSTATGERNERLGNDPKEQNTGRGSNPAEEIEDPVPARQP